MLRPTRALPVSGHEPGNTGPIWLLLRGPESQPNLVRVDTADLGRSLIRQDEKESGRDPASRESWPANRHTAVCAGGPANHVGQRPERGLGRTQRKPGRGDPQPRPLRVATLTDEAGTNCVCRCISIEAVKESSSGRSPVGSRRQNVRVLCLCFAGLPDQSWLLPE